MERDWGRVGERGEREASEREKGDGDEKGIEMQVLGGREVRENEPDV